MSKMSTCFEKYSAATGALFVFNLIIGTGALTLPLAFSQTGWILGIFFIFCVAFASYVSALLMIEALSNTNAVLKFSEMKSFKKKTDDILGQNSERRPLLYSKMEDTNRDIGYFFEIDKKVEMADMSSLYFNFLGRIIFSISFMVYLYGDLAIYAAAVPQSLRDVLCNEIDGQELSEKRFCWNSFPYLNRLGVYRILVLLFAVLISPFTFMKVSKTKYLQVVTTFMRWTAFIAMIVFAIICILKQNAKPTTKDDVLVKIASFRNVPILFGVSIYSFMCHHSLPAIVTPIVCKSRFLLLLKYVFAIILCFYVTLSLTALYAFPNHIQDLYTLNFRPSIIASNHSKFLTFLSYFLLLFPVFTLTTNFPIIAITLSNNIKSLFESLFSYKFHYFPAYSLAAIIPPFIAAFITHDLEFLVSITGSYPGACIQYIFPVLFVYFSRKEFESTFSSHISTLSSLNPYKSCFHSASWLIFILLWAFASFILISIYNARAI